ncbi:hypothetical protein L1887_55613 [Cichorium endivia]|nr:hypothetical protein L1887_55613 [Cichorium endivia]
MPVSLCWNRMCDDCALRRNSRPDRRDAGCSWSLPESCCKDDDELMHRNGEVRTCQKLEVGKRSPDISFLRGPAWQLGWKGALLGPECPPSRVDCPLRLPRKNHALCSMAAACFAVASWHTLESSVDRLARHALLVAALLRRAVDATAVAEVELAVALRVGQTGDGSRGGEVGVAERLVGRDALCGVELEQLVEQVDGQRMRLGEHVLEGHSGHAWERSDLDLGRVVHQSLHGGVVGRAEDAQDLVELVVVVAAAEERQTRNHLGHDATGTPDIDRGRVGSRAKQNVGRTVPERHDLVGECVDRDAEGTRKTKVGELEFAALVDEKVLRLEIAVQHAVLVAEGGALEQLEHEGAHGDRIERTAVAMDLHVLLEVLLHELEDEHQLGLGVDDVVESHDVGVAQLLHERDLTDRRRRRALLGIEVDLLERDDLIVEPRAPFVHGGVCALAELLELDVVHAEVSSPRSTG